MRPIDADALMDDIKRDSKKAIDEGDKVGSFWLGYIAGLVIKQPTIQSALDSETLIRTIETGITATNSNDAYSLGMRNGMRWCKSLIDGAEPKFEDDAMSVDDGKELPPAQPEPQEGQWIPHESPDGGVQYECSECGVLWEFNDGTPEDNEAYFCPKCGARMKGEI